MKRLASQALFAMVCTATITAQTGNRVEHWTAKDIDAVEKTLTAAAKTSGTEGKDLLTAPLHRVRVQYREQALDAEQHRDLTDIIIVKGGAARLLIGGQLVGRKGPEDEPRGTSITGARQYPAAAGDVFNIPPGIPHQWAFDRGQWVSFYIVKVREKATGTK